ncbi:hypothetical protein [Halobacillus amylolyticus]|uniref:Uncharacterized protein n=1 Tax=Halobacillus amylolyticus TaxID=2932259 RepID=A0ABY4HBR1_9BACI|nr:hypothetical protein [Halobacillus amylolyticus]UOR11877.1 hypothetical protein MUO15_20365 [Halobacillus amylolyticus]
MNFKSLSQQYESEYTEKVSQLLRIPSVYEESADFPYGKAIDQSFKRCLRLLKRMVS